MGPFALRFDFGARAAHLIHVRGRAANVADDAFEVGIGRECLQQERIVACNANTHATRIGQERIRDVIGGKIIINVEF